MNKRSEMFIKKLESDNLAVSDNDFEIEPSSPFNNDKDKNLDLLVEEVPDKEMESIILDAMQEEIPNSLMVHPPTDLIKVDSEINISPLGPIMPHQAQIGRATTK